MFRPCVIPTLAICMCVVSPIASAQGAKDVKRLTLHDAIQAALANNLAIEVSRTNWRGAKEAGTLVEEAGFEFILGASGTGGWSKSGSSSNNPYNQPGIGSFDAETVTSSYSNNRNLSLSIQKAFTWGGSAQLSYSPRYSGSSSETSITFLDPTIDAIYRRTINSTPYSGSWGLSYSQNLLRGFGNKVNTASLVIAQRGLVTADANFKRAVQDQVVAVESVYWNLVRAQMNLVNQRQSLELAERLLKENQIRVETGILAPIEVTSSKASVAQREASIIQAEADFQNAKDTFIRTVYSTTERPDDIELIDTPVVSQLTLEEKGAIETALKNRTELLNRRLELENAKLQEEVAQSNLKPTLSASIAYNGSAQSSPSFGPINSDITAFRYPGYNINVNFNMPLQNKSARASDIRARANRRASELSLRDQELAITLDVRTAYRNLLTAEKSIIATEQSRILAQETYDAEQMRLTNGLSTNFVVSQRQNELDNAKTVELNAKISYANAQTALQQAMGTLLNHRNIRVQ